MRVGLIGIGHMGKLHLLNALKIEGIEVVAAADKSEKNRKGAEELHIATYDDYQKLIDKEKLDCVIVSLPNFLKKESVMYAAEHKLDIFLDKPIARNLVEAQEIARKVEKENIRLMVGANYRFFDCVKSVRELFEEGRIGRAVITTSDLILNGPFSHPLVPVPVPEWWLSKEQSGGGALLDLGYHLIDLLVWLFGDLEVVHSDLRHSLNLAVDDAVTLTLKAKNSDLTCVVNAGWFMKSIFPEFNFRMNIHGTAGYTSTEQYTPRNLRTHAVKAGMSNILRRMTGRELHYLSYTYYYASFYDILKTFFNSIEQGKEFPISVKDQLEVMRIISSVYGEHGEA